MASLSRCPRHRRPEAAAARGRRHVPRTWPLLRPRAFSDPEFCSNSCQNATGNCCRCNLEQLTDLLQQYAASFRDPMMLQPPEWFKAFIYCEAFLQLPFFPIAAYAFLKGGCRWIRTPAIIYSTHVATTLFAILAHILFHDFSKSEHAGPQTLRERLVLLSIYLPYLLIPLLLLFTMLCNPHYKHVEKRKRK